MKTDTWIQKNIPSMVGKTVAISGATGGIGQELCRHLAGLGANLLLLDRNSERSNTWIEKLKVEFPTLNARHLRLDLADFSTVRSVTEELLLSPPDYLFFNAGAYHVPRYTTGTGHDNVFQINFVAPYYMAHTLLPIMRERGGRIVAVGSIAHNYSHIDLSDVEFLTRKESSKVYGNAKRFLMFSLFGLDKDGGTISVAHPGITLTNITAHYPKLIYAIIKHPMKVIFMSPRRASLSILAAMVQDADKNEWFGPSLFDIWGLPRKKLLKTCSADEAAQICGEAERIVANLKDQK
ncbi:MAG: SDR family NAD(P)-dependent oxidoreductase [Ruminococcaceae bacterium]|nr:SDR family NAD(P)-dependent oxidoreductase [Oscillospiraceae bacterium]